MERNYCSYLPPYYEGIREFEWLGETVDAELKGVAAGADKWLNDQFVLTASEASLKRREEELGIQADPTLESLDFRKSGL